MTLSDEFKQFNEVDVLQEKLKKAEALLNASIPFIETFYELSAPTMGIGARTLVERIYTFLAGINEASK